MDQDVCAAKLAFQEQVITFERLLLHLSLPTLFSLLPLPLLYLTSLGPHQPRQFRVQLPEVPSMTCYHVKQRLGLSFESKESRLLTIEEYGVPVTPFG